MTFSHLPQRNPGSRADNHSLPSVSVRPQLPALPRPQLITSSSPIRSSNGRGGMQLLSRTPARILIPAKKRGGGTTTRRALMGRVILVTISDISAMSTFLMLSYHVPMASETASIIGPHASCLSFAHTLSSRAADEITGNVLGGVGEASSHLLSVSEKCACPMAQGIG